MDKILIVKLGALGDVVRTTPLLRVLPGEITWVTQRNAMPLFQNGHFLHRVLDIRNCEPILRKNEYRLILSLDEDPYACRLVTSLKKKELVGTYENGNNMVYTDSSARWFDMSLISRFGRKEADRKKWLNRKTYQEMIFEMLGKKFKGEEYILPPRYYNKEENSGTKETTVGMESRSGERWIGKRWPHFPELIRTLKANRIPYLTFRQMPTLGKFIRMVNKADIVVTPDTLTLHLALALQKKVVSIFTITPPHEIYGYGRMIKIINPRLKKYFYSTKPSTKPGEHIPAESVFQALQKLRNAEQSGTIAPALK